MKLKKFIASATAAAIAVTTVTITTLTTTVSAALAPELPNDNWQDPRSYSVSTAEISATTDFSKVDKVVFKMEAHDLNWGYNNGAVVVNTGAGAWEQILFGGTNTNDAAVIVEETGMFEVPVSFTPDSWLKLIVTGVSDKAFSLHEIEMYEGADLFGTYSDQGFVLAQNDPEPEDEPDGSVTLNTTNWWAQQDLTVEQLLANKPVDEVGKVVFESDFAFQVGFNGVDGEWTQISAESVDGNYVLELDPALVSFAEENYAFIVAISTDDGLDHTIIWNVIDRTSKVLFHYHRYDDNYDGWGIHFWGVGVEPPAKFTVDGDWATAVIEYKGKPAEEIGFLVTTADWTKDPDGDRFIKAEDYIDDVAEVWLLSGDATIYKTEPQLGEPTKSVVKFNYHRDDAEYAGWNVFHWGAASGSVAFEYTEGDWATATLEYIGDPAEVGFIVRYSTADNEWAGREVSTAGDSGDRTIAVEKYADGTVEVWIVSGDVETYFEQPELNEGGSSEDESSNEESSEEESSNEESSEEESSNEESSEEESSNEESSEEESSDESSDIVPGETESSIPEDDSSDDTSDVTSDNTSDDTSSDDTSDVTSDDTSSDVKPDVKPGDCTGEVPEYVIKASSSKEGSVTVGLEAQFDPNVGTIGEWPALPTTTMTADGSDVTLTYDFSDYGKVKFGGNYVAIATDLAWEDMEAQPDLYSAANVAIKSIKLDGVEVGDVSKLCVNNEANGGKALRITLLNEWNDNFKGNAPLSGIELPEFSKVEVTFAVTDAAKGGEDVPPPTGVTVTVIPAAFAAVALAATIVIKKRK